GLASGGGCHAMIEGREPDHSTVGVLGPVSVLCELRRESPPELVQSAADAVTHNETAMAEEKRRRRWNCCIGMTPSELPQPNSDRRSTGAPPARLEQALDGGFG